MSDVFVKWSVGDSGIYYDEKTGKYSTILSDLSEITFTNVEAAEAWLDEYFKKLRKRCL